MTNGYQNEIDFINQLDGKKFKELNPIFQDMIQTLYPTIKQHEIIHAAKYGRYAKTDVVLTVRGKKKGLSIKCGCKNSVHVEPIFKFQKYLELNKVNGNTIEKLKRYLYADGTNNNTGVARVTNSEYVNLYESSIKDINSELDFLKRSLCHRFLIEADIKYRVKVAAFIHGVPNDFIWVTAEEIEDYLFITKYYSSSVHVGKLYIQSWDKNIKRNLEYEYRREYIQVKWFSMYDDMIAIMAKRNSLIDI